MSKINSGVKILSFLSGPRVHTLGASVYKCAPASSHARWSSCALDFSRVPQVPQKVPSDPTVLCRVPSASHKSVVLTEEMLLKSVSVI